MAERVAAVLFDFDHTLTDFGDHVAWAEARPAMRAVYLDAGVPEAFLDAYPGSHGLYSAVAAHAPLKGVALLEVQRRASAILAEYEATGIETTDPLPGARELLDALPRLGVPAGIVTSNASSVVHAILARLGLATPFEVLIGREHVTLPKPDPEGLFAACEALAVVPAEAVYVGDMAGDVLAAHAAGMQAWAVTTGLGTSEELRAAGADALFATLDGVLARLSQDAPFSAQRAMTARRP